MMPAEQTEQRVGGDGQNVNRGRGDFRKHTQRYGYECRYGLGMSQSETLGNQLSNNEGKIGDSHDNNAQTNRLTVGLDRRNKA